MDNELMHGTLKTEVEDIAGAVAGIEAISKEEAQDFLESIAEYDTDAPPAELTRDVINKISGNGGQR